MAIVEYIVKEGDRWDSISLKAYGDPLLFSRIIESNPAIIISPLLTAGTRLVIPVLEQSDIKLDSELLPPWKR